MIWLRPANGWRILKLTCCVFLILYKKTQGGIPNEKYPISHYKKSGSSLFINGGTLTVTDSECLVEYLNKEVVRFSLRDTVVTKASPELLYEGIRLTHDGQSIDLYFPKMGKAIRELREHFHMTD